MSRKKAEEGKTKYLKRNTNAHRVNTSRTKEDWTLIEAKCRAFSSSDLIGGGKNGFQQPLTRIIKDVQHLHCMCGRKNVSTKRSHASGASCRLSYHEFIKQLNHDKSTADQ